MEGRMKLFELIFEYFISYLIVVLWRQPVTHRQLILIFPNFYQTFLKFFFLRHHTKILAAGGGLHTALGFLDDYEKSENLQIHVYTMSKVKI